MNRTALLVWGLALIVTGNLTYSAIRHDMPVLDILALTLLSLYGAKAGAEHAAVILRRKGADR